MRYRLLGPVELSAGGELVSLAQPRHRGILAYLLLHANRLVTQDQLVEAVWGGAEPASATAQIHVAVSRLRGALRGHGLPDAIATRAGGYTLAAAAEEIDAEIFAAELAIARDTDHYDPRKTIERLDRALRLWRGEPLADVTAAYAPAVRHRLHEQRLAAQELRVEAELALGRHAAVVPALTQLVSEHPLREGLVCQLMLALYRAGRPRDATQLARDTRQALATELGLDPGPQFVKLEHAILNADPGLDLMGATVSLGGQAAPRIPAQLPPDVPSFTGREQELTKLDGVAPGSVIVVTGPAGAGKTALATHWAHRVRDRFPDGQLYLDLRGFDPASDPLTALESLTRLLRGLGLDAARVPSTADEASALLRSILHGKRVLLLLDNARDAAQVRPLFPADGGCGVLITSRQALVTLDAFRLEIGGLTPREGVELLARYAGTRLHAEGDAALRLLEYCQLLPLAIRVSGARLLAEPGLPLAELADGLADERSRLDLLELDDLAVRASVGASYRTLDRATGRAFTLLSVLRCHDIDVYVGAALWDVSVHAARQSLHRLTAARLVERAGDRYRLHDLIRLFAMERQAEESDAAELAEAALVRVATCLLGASRRATTLLRPGQALVGDDELAEAPYANLVPLSDVDGARTWFETERANLIALADQLADAADPLCRYPLRLQGAMTMYLAAAGHFADWHHLCELSAAQARRLNDTVAEAVALMNLGAIACRQGRFEQAVQDLNRALELSRAADRPSTQAGVLSYLASAYTEMGEPNLAGACHEEAIRLRRLVGDARSTSHTIGNAALHYLVQRRLGEARSHLNEALEIKYAEQDLGGAAVSEVQLAAVLMAQGLQAEALRAAEKGLELSRRYGDRFNEWVALLLCSVMYRRQGRAQQSLDYAAACVSVCVAMGQLTAANYVASLTALPSPGHDEGDPLPLWLVAALDQAGETTTAPAG